MDPQAALTMGQNALFMLLMVAAPVLAAVLGLACWSACSRPSRRSTKPRSPSCPSSSRAIAVFAIAGPWMMTTMVEFIRSTILSIPNYAI
jgi:flagellar biosynthetic protein FliQ